MRPRLSSVLRVASRRRRQRAGRFLRAAIEDERHGFEFDEAATYVSSATTFTAETGRRIRCQAIDL